MPQPAPGLGSTNLQPANLQPATGQGRTVTIPVGAASLKGILAVPEDAKAIVVFAHGSGSGRESPRNAYVARVLEEAGFGTLLFDLLEEREAAEQRNRFDIDLLAARLQGATEWLRQQPEAAQLRIGFFGASTGAAAALQAAAGSEEEIFAIVSRGGRPDLAATHLASVRAPTLLIVGGNDGPIIGANQAAEELLRCPHESVIVPGAGHTFEEPGTLEEVARLARAWFQRCLEETPGDTPLAAKRKVRIALTREQQLELAATTGVMLGILEIDAEALEAGELPWAQIPGLEDAHQ
jgi:putative phosphoribosyl transferase